MLTMERLHVLGFVDLGLGLAIATGFGDLHANPFRSHLHTHALTGTLRVQLRLQVLEERVIKEPVPRHVEAVLLFHVAEQALELGTHVFDANYAGHRRLTAIRSSRRAAASGTPLGQAGFLANSTVALGDTRSLLRILKLPQQPLGAPLDLAITTILGRGGECLPRVLAQLTQLVFRLKPVAIAVAPELLDPVLRRW